MRYSFGLDHAESPSPRSETVQPPSARTHRKSTPRETAADSVSEEISINSALSIFPELKPLNISTSRTSSFITAYGLGWTPEQAVGLTPRRGGGKGALNLETGAESFGGLQEVDKSAIVSPQTIRRR